MTNTPVRVNAAPTSYLPGTWKIDPTRSSITFSVRNLGAIAHGRFTGFSATVVTAQDPMRSSIVATIDLATFDTGNAKRDQHIRSADFLDVAANPHASYRSNAVRRTDDSWIIDGDLTMHGITRAVPVVVTGVDFPARRTPGAVADFTATAVIDRRDFGIARYSGGGLLSGTKATVRLEITTILQP